MTSYYPLLLKKKDCPKLVERQRRHTMKSLCSILTSLIPPQNFKGKRSLADQILASTCYIHDLRNEVVELEKKRDKLRILSGMGKLSHKRLEENGCEIKIALDGSDTFPTVRLRNVGSGIQVTVNCLKQHLAFSDLIEVLEEGGIEIVSALVSSPNAKIFYTLQCKIYDGQSFDCKGLSERIWHLIKENSPRDMPASTR